TRCYRDWSSDVCSSDLPMTADDVAFTFHVIYDSKIPNSLQDVLTVAGKPIEVTKVDALTIRFRTVEPFGPFLRSIGVGILPRHRSEERRVGEEVRVGMW